MQVNLVRSVLITRVKVIVQSCTTILRVLLLALMSMEACHIPCLPNTLTNRSMVSYHTPCPPNTRTSKFMAACHSPGLPSKSLLISNIMHSPCHPSTLFRTRNSTAVCHHPYLPSRALLALTSMALYHHLILHLLKVLQ